MKVKSAGYGRLKAVKSDTAGVMLPTDEQVSAAFKVVKPSGKKPNTRPLNAYIAYRCYYSPVLATLQQKDISGIMTNFWQSEPAKDKWAILAKAYTLIRDKKGKANAPLDVYLDLAAPRVGILKPDEYMIKLGWEIVVGSNGETLLRRNPDTYKAYSNSGVILNASVQDILATCYEHGYIDAEDGDLVKMPENQVVLTMSTSAGAVHHVNKSNQGLTITANGAAQPPPDKTSLDNDSPMAEVKKGLAAYSPAFLDRIVNEIMTANPAVESGTDIFPDNSYNAEFIPGDTMLRFDPFAIDEYDSFDMMGDLIEPVNDFDINQWLELDAYES